MACVETQGKPSASKWLRVPTLHLCCRLRFAVKYQHRAYTLHSSQAPGKATLLPLVASICSASQSKCCCSVRKATLFAAISINHRSLLVNSQTQPNSPFLMNISKSIFCFQRQNKEKILFTTSISHHLSVRGKKLGYDPETSAGYLPEVSEHCSFLNILQVTK